MKKLPKDKRDKIILIGMGTAVAVASLWMWVITSQHKTLDALDTLRNTQLAKVENAERIARTVSDIEKRMSEASGRLKVVEKDMASGDMYAWVIATINQFKEGYNVDIPQYSREVKCDVGLLPRFPYGAALFQLRGTALYRDLGRFIADLENKFPYMRVQNLEIEPVGQTAVAGEDPERLSFRMEIVALVNPNQTQP